MSDTPAIDAPSDPETPGDAGDLLAEHPEIYVGAAFAGGLVLATALRLLGR